MSTDNSRAIAQAALSALTPKNEQPPQNVMTPHSHQLTAQWRNRLSTLDMTPFSCLPMGGLCRSTMIKNTDVN